MFDRLSSSAFAEAFSFSVADALRERFPAASISGQSLSFSEDRALYLSLSGVPVTMLLELYQSSYPSRTTFIFPSSVNIVATSPLRTPFGKARTIIGPLSSAVPLKVNFPAVTVVLPTVSCRLSFIFVIVTVSPSAAAGAVPEIE